jgi:hypothetical protein
MNSLKLGQELEAAMAFEAALTINPRMDEMARMARQLRARVASRAQQDGKRKGGDEGGDPPRLS